MQKRSDTVDLLFNNCKLLMKFFYTRMIWTSLNYCFVTPNHKLSDQYHLCKRSKLDSSLWWHSVAVSSLIKRTPDHVHVSVEEFH